MSVSTVWEVTTLCSCRLYCGCPKNGNFTIPRAIRTKTTRTIRKPVEFDGLDDDIRVENADAISREPNIIIYDYIIRMVGDTWRPFVGRLSKTLLIAY